MPKGLYELGSGIDSNAILNIRLDTLERNNRLEESLHIPDYKSLPIPKYDSFIPKDLQGDDLIDGKDVRLPSLKEALTSTNRKISDAAQDVVRQQASKNPVTYGIGTKQYVPYTEGQNKFTNDSFFKGRRNTMYGYNPYVSMAENEDFNHKNVWNSYSNVGKAWRGAGLFAGRALSKAVTGIVGMVGDLGSMAWNGLEELGEAFGGRKNNFWNDISNNGLSREMEKWDNHVKEQWLPTYKALNYDNKGAWEKLMDPYTWTNSFADGAGFLLQFVAPSIVFGKIGQAGRLARSIGTLEAELATAQSAGDIAKVAKLGKTIEEAKRASSFTKAMGYDITNKYGKNVAQALTGSENVGGISAHVFNTMLESVAETKEGFNHTVRELMNRGMSREEAIKIAGENAPGQFWANVGILSLSNAFENKLLQKALGNRALSPNMRLGANTLPETAEAATTKFGKFFEPGKFGNRIKFYGTMGTKAAWWEGFWEENAQTAASRWAAGHYNRQGDDGGGEEETGSFIEQLYKQTRDAIKGNDREAADSIMAGAVIGVLGGSVFSKLAGTRKEISTPEVRDKDGNIIQQKTIIKPKTFLPEGQRRAEIREKAQKVSDFINRRDAWLSIRGFDSDIYDDNGKLNQEKVNARVDEIKEKVSKINVIVAQSINAENILNPYQREKLQHTLFNSYVKAHIMNGTEDALIERLKDWKTKTIDELSLYGVSNEMAANSNKWAGIAENLVETYNKTKDIRYAAPSNTTLEEYQNTSKAIHSVIFDHIAYRDMHQNLANEYQNLMNEDNPFSDTPLLQEYNESQLKLIKLRQKLQREDLNVIDRENVKKEIEKLEKDQKQRKDTFATLNETEEDKNGLVFPKGYNKEQKAKKLDDNQGYFSLLNEKVDNDILAQNHDNFIKEYSDEATGYQKYLDSIAFWDKINSDPADKKIEEEEVKEIKKTKESLHKQFTDLQNTLQEAFTKEARDKIQAELDKIKEEIAAINEELDDKNKTNKTDKTGKDTPIPTEKQYATLDTIGSDLAVDTPFKTVNRETFDPKNKDDETIWWKEVAIDHGYDHDLTIFAKKYLNELLTFPNKYELFVIKDTFDLMKERLSTEQLKNYDEGKFKEGAILVFREVGKTDWVKFDNGKIVAFSYNETAFGLDAEYDFDEIYRERVIGNAKRTDRDIKEVRDFFKREQTILEAVREQVIASGNPIQVKSESGSLGLFPNYVSRKVNDPINLAIVRFKGFYDTDNPFTVVKANNKNLIPGSTEGQVYLNIPETSTVNQLPYYIPVYTKTIERGETDSIQERIYQSVEAISYTTFKTRKEANEVKNYLYNFFYVGDKNYFEIKEVDGGFKLIYIDKNGEHTSWLNIPALKLSDKLYNTEDGFSLYEKVNTNFQPTIKITKQQYRDFIHNHLATSRKLIVKNVKNAVEKVYSLPVNAYLNLQIVNELDSQTGTGTQTTEEAVIQPMVDLRSEESQNDRVKQSEENKEIAKPVLKLNFNITDEDIIKADNPRSKMEEYEKLKEQYQNLVDLLACI